MREQFFAIQKHLEKLVAGTPGQVQGHVLMGGKDWELYLLESNEILARAARCFVLIGGVVNGCNLVE